jgi:DUF4097 and DUF4098 domain-containing protein YvlB
MNATAGSEPVRTESFDCPAPAELDLRVNLGHIDVRAADVPHVRADVSLEDGGSSDDRALRALQDVQITFSGQNRRLIVRAPRDLRRARLAVSVEAPARSRLAARVHSGSITATGPLADLEAVAGRGDISAGDVEGDAHVSTGAGDVRLGHVAGRLRSRSGSGSVEVASVAGETQLATGRGDVRLGHVDSNVTARIGKGDLVIARAARGRLRLATGSGDVRIGIQAGAAAEIDLASGSGTARSELDVSDRAPAGTPAVSVRARTGSGDAVVARAAE